MPPLLLSCNLTYDMQKRCWFFASLVQVHLSILGDGFFRFGRFPSLGLGLRTRVLISQEVEVRFGDNSLRDSIC